MRETSTICILSCIVPGACQVFTYGPRPAPEGAHPWPRRSAAGAPSGALRLHTLWDHWLGSKPEEEELELFVICHGQEEVVNDVFGIENALKIINELEDGKFPLLLSRIAQFLSNNSSGRPFTSVEESKLESSLDITKAEVETLIDGIIEIFLASAYCVLKPSLLGEQLAVLHLNAKKAEAFVQVWAASAKGIVDNLKQKNFFPQLDHISYSVSIKTASESVSKEKSPKAQLQLNLSSIQKTEDINLEFSHEELCELYKKLEQVQGQLDALR